MQHTNKTHAEHEIYGRRLERRSRGVTSRCANFVAAKKTNTISKAGKKAEGFRSKWVLMDAKCSHPRLVLPMGMPTSHDGWFRAKLDDPRAELVLERMTADLKPDDPRAAKLTGAMIVKEFMAITWLPSRCARAPCGSSGAKETTSPASGGTI